MDSPGGEGERQLTPMLPLSPPRVSPSLGQSRMLNLHKCPTLLSAHLDPVPAKLRPEI